MKRAVKKSVGFVESAEVVAAKRPKSILKKSNTSSSSTEIIECSNCARSREIIQKITTQLKEVVQFVGNSGGENADVVADLNFLSQKIVQTQLMLQNRCKNFENNYLMKEEECKKAEELRVVAEATCEEMREKIEKMAAERKSLEETLLTLSDEAKRMKSLETEVKILQNDLRATNEKKNSDRIMLMHKMKTLVQKHEENLFNDLKRMINEKSLPTEEEPPFKKSSIKNPPAPPKVKIAHSANPIDEPKKYFPKINQHVVDYNRNSQNKNQSQFQSISSKYMSHIAGKPTSPNPESMRQFFYGNLDATVNDVNNNPKQLILNPIKESFAPISFGETLRAQKDLRLGPPYCK